MDDEIGASVARNHAAIWEAERDEFADAVGVLKTENVRLERELASLRAALEEARYLVAHYLEGDDVLVEAACFLSEIDAALAEEEK